jgi:hypothetical protein
MEEEWEIYVHKSAVCRPIKKERVSPKKAQLTGPCSQLLRTEWQARMHNIVAEQLVVCDESIFRNQSCWRCVGYGPIGELYRNPKLQVHLTLAGEAT